MLHHKSRSACGEIIHVRQILAELWSLTLRIFAHFNLSSQLLLHPCMDLNETWQGCCYMDLNETWKKCCATSLDKRGVIIHALQNLQKSLHLKCVPYNFVASMK